MKDEKYTPAIGSWLKGREVAPPDSRETARQVAARLPQVRQRRRWWSLPRLRRGAPPSSTNHTYQQTPTVTGRTHSMFSPVKAITAGALILAIGGVSLIAQPFGQEADLVPGAEADVAPAAVTGTVSELTEESRGTPTMVEGFGMLREGLQYTNTWDANDPRLSGESTVVANSVSFSEQQMQTGTANVTLENDAGRWAGSATFLDGERLGETETYILRGEDAYAGLNAYVVVQRPSGPDGGTLDAAIFPGEMPEYPAAAGAE